jgi:hypothetical protein
MHQIQSMQDWRPTLVGTLYAGATGATYHGNAVCINGFGEARLLVAFKTLTAGTAVNLATLTLKVQESATLAGTGSAWSDITDGEVMGSFKVALTLTAPGTHVLEATSAYERLVRGDRKQFIRVHATIAGTAGIGAALAAGFMLGSPISTLYVTNPVLFSTNSAEVTNAG